MRQWQIGEVKGHRSGWYSRHSLIDGLHSVSHGELIHYLLGHVVKVDLPRLVPFHLRDLHHAAALHLRQVVEQVLRVAREITQSGSRWWSTVSQQVVKGSLVCGCDVEHQKETLITAGVTSGILIRPWLSNVQLCLLCSMITTNSSSSKLRTVRKFLIT